MAANKKRSSAIGESRKLGSLAALPVRVEAERVARCDQDVEATVHFCVLEALQNAQKYARAGEVVMRLRDDEGTLQLPDVRHPCGCRCSGSCASPQPAADRGLDARVGFFHGSAREWKRLADCVICVGAAHAWRGAEDTRRPQPGSSDLLVGSFSRTDSGSDSLRKMRRKCSVTRSLH